MSKSALIDLRNLRKVTNTVFYPLFGEKARILILVGGAGSGKSFFVPQKMVIRCLLEPNHHMLACRKVARTLKYSVFAQLMSTIHTLGVSDLWTINRTDYSFSCTNGSLIHCVGLEDSERVKSIVSETGAGVSCAWLEEATEMSEADATQINLRMRGSTDKYFQVIYSFNPISPTPSQARSSGLGDHWIKRLYFDKPQDPKAVRIIKTTYKDNRFLDSQYRDVLEGLKSTDKQLHRIYALGEWGRLEGVIYKPFILDEWPPFFEETIYGLDFGFNNPTALVEVNIEKSEVYLAEKIYETRMTNNDLIDRMKRLGIPRDAAIYCDSAEPARIEELYRAGFRGAVPAYKGPDSVRAGISFMQSLEIHARPEDKNLIAEGSVYKWQVDKNGVPMEIPIDVFNHLMDASRYAIYTHWGAPKVEKAKVFHKDMIVALRNETGLDLSGSGWDD